MPLIPTEQYDKHIAMYYANNAKPNERRLTNQRRDLTQKDYPLRAEDYAINRLSNFVPHEGYDDKT